MPAVVDLAAMRNAIADLGGDPARINPLIPAELVIDHSVQVDEFASRLAFARNVELEVERNRERYAFLRWGQASLRDFKVVPPGTGICHQVNLEYLARVVESRDGVAFPDTVVGHRLAHDDGQRPRRARLGRRRDRGRGGDARRAAVDARAAGRRLPADGRAARGRDRDRPRAHRRPSCCAAPASSGSSSSTSATGVSALTVADRATLGNMSPEYGATCGFFPVDELTLDYLRLTGRADDARRARRGLLPREPALARAGRASGVLAGRRARPRTTSSRRSRARAARRTACRSRARRSRSSRRSPRFGVELDDGRRGARRDVPGERSDDRAGAGRATSRRAEHAARRRRADAAAAARCGSRSTARSTSSATARS